MKSIQITVATIDDISSMVDLYTLANSESSKEDIAFWTKEGLELFPTLNYVYKIGAEITAAISARVEDGKLSIYDLVVKKQQRKKGIGSKLLEHVCKIAKAENIQICTLWVHCKNTSAIPFYYKCGFSMIKTEKTKNVFGYPDGEEIVWLEKRLTK